MLHHTRWKKLGNLINHIIIARKDTSRVVSKLGFQLTRCWQQPTLSQIFPEGKIYITSLATFFASFPGTNGVPEGTTAKVRGFPRGSLTVIAELICGLFVYTQYKKSNTAIYLLFVSVVIISRLSKIYGKTLTTLLKDTSDL
jgi:hypothetical protein